MTNTKTSQIQKHDKCKNKPNANTILIQKKPDKFKIMNNTMKTRQIQNMTKS
jgi:hypothetical protein